MKKSIVISIVLIFVFVKLNAQEVSLPSKFLTLRNARISMGLGMERGQSRFIGSPSDFKSLIDSSHYDVYSASFDLYAPNSFLGFMIEANYGNWDLGIRNSQSREYFLVRTLEIPFYLKFRFGRIEATSRMWFLAGASYILPIMVHREFNNTLIDKNKTQINGVKVLTATLGYEQYFGERSTFKASNPLGTYDRMRIVFFTRFSYLLDSRINSYYYNSNTTKSILNNYKDFIFDDYVISIGIKYFFRLGRFNQGNK